MKEMKGFEVKSMMYLKSSCVPDRVECVCLRAFRWSCYDGEAI